MRQVPRLAAYDWVVSSSLAVRPARVGDVAQMARVNAFYRRHGFVADGAAQVEGGMREIRMVRGRQHRR